MVLAEGVKNVGDTKDPNNNLRLVFWLPREIVKHVRYIVIHFRQTP